ncbi:MAG: 6-bladed beta-propeller [Nitrosopumilus sp.]
MLSKLTITVTIFSLFLASAAFVQYSSALGDYDLISEWGQFGIANDGHLSYPEFIAVDSEGNSYVSDLGNKRIQKFSSTGEYVSHWGQSGTLPGEFHYPSGIAIDGNFVYVADHDLHKIQKFSLNGTFVEQWGQKGIHDGQFKYPNGVAVDSDGFVYVVDTGNQRIQKFTSDGDFVLSFGSSGMGAGQFLTAIGIDVDEEGYVYVTDKGNRKIEKFDSEGTLIQSFPYSAPNYVFSPEGISVDPTGKIFVVNSANNLILYLDPEKGLSLDTFEKLGPFSEKFVSPIDVTLGVNGELLVVDSAAHKVKSFETPFYVEPQFSEKIEIAVPEIIDDFSSDDIDPTIMAPSDLILEATDYYTPVFTGEAVASDNDSGINTILNNAPEKFSLGVSKVTWIAFDNAGNTAEAFQIITINACGKSQSEYNHIVGTNGDDILQGTSSDDLIFGLGGSDVIIGNDGNDCIFGGDGDDIISGNGGDDTITGNTGHDILRGQSGSDVLYSNHGSDVIDGGVGSDRCYAFSDSENYLMINCE